MAQIDANATLEQLEQMEREFARKRAAAERRRASELARLSEERTLLDENRTSWVYVTVDKSFARIIACMTQVEDLVIPDELDGWPVREIGPEAFTRLESLKSARCPDEVVAIGTYAFRGCSNMERLVLPTALESFSASWITGCPSLEELVLPGTLKDIGPEALSNPAVKRLVIGAGTSGVKPGAFEKSHLETVSIDERNPWLSTDGICLYSSDKSRLVCLTKRTEAYEVDPHCREISPKAFVNAIHLQHITLPQGLELIGDFAFAYSGIEQLDCPSTLVEVGMKAFLHCKSLRKAHLNEGLQSIGAEAFANSGLGELSIPASVVHLGSRITARSNVRHAEPDATFAIDPSNPVYYTDSFGCLYRRAEDGIHLGQFLDPHAESYCVRAGTIAIDKKAFAFHASLQEVDLPDGLRTIGESAFRMCEKLQRVSIPDSLESIGKDAFIDTSLEGFHVPAALVEIGECALVTSGAHHEGAPPSLRAIEVDADNPRFFMHTGMLCRKTSTGTNIVVFTSACEQVYFSDDVEVVEDYAFNNAFGIEELRLNARLRSIGACGLSVWCHIRHVRIDVAEPIEGRSSFVLQFPNTSRSVHGFLLALGGLGHLYLPDIMAQYDKCIASARDYHAPGNSDNASAYEQVKLIVDRLRDSVLLTNENRQRYHRLLDENIETICVDISRHDDRETIRHLADLGLLHEGNIEKVIAAVSQLQDAAMTGYLLELKRTRFNCTVFDFDL